MHVFNRGFNGHPVNLVPGGRTGPVVFQAPAGPGAPVPVLSQGQQQVSQVKPAASVIAMPPVKAPAAPPPAPTKPGAVPMGPKASCPVCRTFGG